MLARRLTTILPAMTLAEGVETPRRPRVAGWTGRHTAFVPAPVTRHTTPSPTSACYTTQA
jgi:hypothetical protein